jgi:hypothetical protein
MKMKHHGWMVSLISIPSMNINYFQLNKIKAINIFTMSAKKRNIPMKKRCTIFCN